MLIYFGLLSFYFTKAGYVYDEVLLEVICWKGQLILVDWKRTWDNVVGIAFRLTIFYLIVELD